MIRFLLRQLLRNYGGPDHIRSILESETIKAAQRQVEAAQSSTFHPEAVVSNLAGQRGKIRIGENTHVRGELLVFPYGGQIEIGNYCYIGKNTTVWSADSVKIGNFVLISHGCNIIDTDSHEIDPLERASGFVNLLREGHPKTRPNVRSSPIQIDDYAWLSYGVNILKGITIGRGAIVGAGSTVTRDVPPLTIVAGNPAKIIGTITARNLEGKNLDESEEQS